MLSARNRGALEKFLPFLECSDIVVGHEDWYREELTQRLGMWQETPCYQAAWLAEEPPELPPFDGKLRPLDLEWAPFIFAHYGKSDIGGLPHIEEAVRQGMLGAFVDGELAGFVGFHPEGSIGLLEVLPPYRRWSGGSMPSARCLWTTPPPWLCRKRRASPSQRTPSTGCSARRAETTRPAARKRAAGLPAGSRSISDPGARRCAWGPRPCRPGG